MNYKIKKDWMTKAGLRAVVTLVHPTYPHFCGYVGLPKEHPAFGKPWYKTIEDDVDYTEEYKNIMEQINDVNVHGGMTYSTTTNIMDSYPALSTDEVHWFGFDAAHAGDAVDWESGKELIDTKEEEEQLVIVKEIMNRHPIPGDVIRTEEYMIEECEKLAEQLVNIK